jgi:hypothetical protein
VDNWARRSSLDVVVYRIAAPDVTGEVIDAEGFGEHGGSPATVGAHLDDGLGFGKVDQVGEEVEGFRVGSHFVDLPTKRL